MMDNQTGTGTLVHIGLLGIAQRRSVNDWRRYGPRILE